MMAYLLIALASLAAEDSGSRNWPGFLAHGGNRSNAPNLPLRWSPETGIAWEADIPGYGQSSPVVWGQQVYVTSIEGENKEKCWIHAFDAGSGKKIWSRVLVASQQKKASTMVSRAAPTSAVDKNGLYVFFESGELARFTHQGEKIWERSLVKEYGEFQSGHGIGSSLAQSENAIFILIAHDGPSYLLAVNKSDGKTKWKTERESGVSWTSPILAKLKNKSLVIVSSSGSVKGYAADTGNELWSMEEIRGNNVPSASILGDRILLGASPSRRNPNDASASRSNCCLLLNEQGGKVNYEVAWRADKATSTFATPLAHRDCAYFVNKVGVLFCLDLKTGKQHYAKRIDGSCWASPLGAGDYVYFFTKKGTTTVIKAGPIFEKVASNDLFKDNAEKPEDSKKSSGRSGSLSGYGSLDPVVYGIAAVDSGIFIRCGKKLYCVRKTSKTAASR